MPRILTVATLALVLCLSVTLTFASSSSNENWGYTEVPQDDSNRDTEFSMMPGGLAPPRDVDSEVTSIVTSLQPAILSNLSSTTALGQLDAANTTVTPVTYRSQVVAGLNYFVKLRISSGDSVNYAVVRIYRPLPGQGEPTVVASRVVDKDSDITYF